MLELRAKDVRRITGETNVGRVVQKNLVRPSIQKSRKRGRGGHVFATFPDTCLFVLNRQLHDLGFTDASIKPVLFMLQRSYFEDLLHVELVLWDHGASFAAAFFDMRRASDRADFKKIEPRVLRRQTLADLLASTYDEVRAHMTPEEREDFEASTLAFADRIQARGGRRGMP